MREAAASNAPAASAVRGGFFTVDSRIWPRVCALGMNPAVAFLVLACGTDKHMAITKWSVNAIEKYTSISRIRAAAGLQLLIERQFVAQGGAWNMPRRRILSAAECPAVSRCAATPCGRRPDLSAPAWIWLPNTIVTGAAGETPPVELVRQTQDVMTLRLFVELYGEQHLRVDSGVRRDLVWEQLKRHDLGPAAEFRVWGFDPTPTRHARWIGAAKCHERAGDKGGAGENFFRRLEAIESAGLIEFIPHLVEGENADAEILHPYGLGQSDSLEDQLGSAASDAAYALLTDQSEGWATRYYVAPVHRHIVNVQMIGIARLRYRAHTRTAAAWQANLHAAAERYLPLYRRIVAERQAR